MEKIKKFLYTLGLISLGLIWLYSVYVFSENLKIYILEKNELKELEKENLKLQIELHKLKLDQ